MTNQNSIVSRMKNSWEEKLSDARDLPGTIPMPEKLTKRWVRGRKRITPYKRTLKTGGELKPKYPGGVEKLKDKLGTEGHSIEERGKRFFVSDFEPKLA